MQKALLIIFVGEIDGEGHSGDDDQKGGEEGDDPLEGDEVPGANSSLLLQPLVPFACTVNGEEKDIKW